MQVSQCSPVASTVSDLIAAPPWQNSFFCPTFSHPRPQHQHEKPPSSQTSPSPTPSALANMDPLESMSMGPARVPKDFNAEDAGNMEDVRSLPPPPPPLFPSPPAPPKLTSHV